MSDIKEKVGTQIKEARKSKGMTQKELGDKLGVSDSTVTQYESGKQNLTIETLHKIAEAIGVTFSTVFK
ncbi:helix-turn-helix domain-containing protein [Spirosoma foliorum]|uniref:Helix-turn-helix transcriptional regulator n=1 Tax=Spirosoma foliorum TaxID=2710596 RepID=A0A7G5H5H1_9BACT|nr:helix-turn-helix transcriptional regulator [Spirosoma foliorum]QMW06363.1 helix-turn-helix transcriptional regulator [Spirosoma foliorum]